MSSYKKNYKNKNILNYEVKHKLGYSGIKRHWAHKSLSFDIQKFPFLPCNIWLLNYYLWCKQGFVLVFQYLRKISPFTCAKKNYFGATCGFYSGPCKLSSVTFMFDWLHFSLINGWNIKLVTLFVSFVNLLIKINIFYVALFILFLL